ncbi:MAG: hypothetical protein AAFY71_08085 [Bacteroidota bacterium]
MKKLALVLSLLALIIPLSSSAQRAETEFFGVDSSGYGKKLFLPMIYFDEGSADVDIRAKQELSYIAFMLHLNPDAALRIRTQALYKRFERQPRRLNKRRMRKIRRVLQKDFSISGKRIVTIHHRPWVYRAARDPRPSKLVKRRVVCDVIWEK